MWLPRPPAAPLILGNNLSAIDAPTLSVLTNTEAIAVSQDALGVQARRVAVQQPKNSTLGFSGQTNIAVVAACDASRPTQCAIISPSVKLRCALCICICVCVQAVDLGEQNCPGRQPVVYVAVPTSGHVSAVDVRWVSQQHASEECRLRCACWSCVLCDSLSFGMIPAGMCVDNSLGSDPLELGPCDASKASQVWVLEPSGHIANGPTSGTCFDIFNFGGPDVFRGSWSVCIISSIV